MGLAYQGLNANNMTVDIVKENGKTGTVGTVVESVVGRAIEDKVIKVKEKLPSGYKVYTTNDFPLWNAYAATGMLAANMVNIGAARASQAVPATILYYNDLLEHETGLPGVDFGRAMGVVRRYVLLQPLDLWWRRTWSVPRQPRRDQALQGLRHPRIAAACSLDAGTQMFSPENTSSLVRDVFGDIPEFKAPLKAVGKEAKKLK